MDPLSFGILAVVAGVVLIFKSKMTASPSLDQASSGSSTNDFGLPDVAPEEQGGSFDAQYDSAFQQASTEIGVPFALLKAHAIRESALRASAYRLEPTGKASYGLMQILWWQNSNRFAQYGFPDDLVRDGSPLYDPLTNARIGAHIIRDNLTNLGNLRDAINAYNTGRKESIREAPGNYDDDVLSYYSTLVGRPVI